jgi:DnaK suppressor protein
MGTQVSADYRPSEAEPFMNERQREYFRRKLNLWKDEILKESRETIQNLQAETVPHADLADRASTEAERQLELRTRDRQRKLIAKIDAALRRIEDGSYGFCEETGEPISLKGWMPGRSPRCRLRRKSATSGAKKCIGTIESFAGRLTDCGSQYS